MKHDEKFIKVLSEVVKELIDPTNKENIKAAEKKAVEKLVEKGFSLEDISSVLDNIFSAMNIAPPDLKIRVIHPSEIQNINDDAKDYLFYLRSNGLLDENNFEEILTASSISNGNIDRNYINNFLSAKGIPNKIIIN